MPTIEELRNGNVTEKGIQYGDGLWVPLHNPKNSLLKWSELISILRKVFPNLTVQPEDTVSVTQEWLNKKVYDLFQVSPMWVTFAKANKRGTQQQKVLAEWVRRFPQVKSFPCMAGVFSTENTIFTWETGNTEEEAQQKLLTKMASKLGYDTPGTITIPIKGRMCVLNWDNLSTFQMAFVNNSYSVERTRKRVKNARDWTNPVVPLHETLPIFTRSNEHLEWSGDSALQSIISAYLRKRFPNADEGFLTKARSKIVRTISLGMCALWYGFNQCLIIDQYHDDWKYAREEPSLLEDVFEAFIGALFEVTNAICGYDIVSKFIIDTFETIIDIPVLVHTDENFKERLMQHYHKAFNTYPTYSEVRSEEIVERGVLRKRYTMAVHDPTGAILATADDFDKQDAEQKAAKKACLSYGLELFDRGPAFFLQPAFAK